MKHVILILTSLLTAIYLRIVAEWKGLKFSPPPLPKGRD